MPRGNPGVDVVPVVGSIAGEGRHVPVDLVEQRPHPRAVIGLLVGQRRRDDPPGVGIGGKMELAPPAPRPCAVLFHKPLAGSAELQSRAVHQQVHGLAPRTRTRHLQRLGPAAYRAVIGHGEVEPEKADDGGDEAFRLAQRQAEHRPQGQRRRDGQVGVAGLTTTASAGLCAPRIDRLCREPHGKAAAGAQTSLVGGPVRHPVPLLWDAVPAVGIGLVRHGGRLISHRGLALTPTYPRVPSRTTHAPRSLRNGHVPALGHVACTKPLRHSAVADVELRKCWNPRVGNLFAARG